MVKTRGLAVGALLAWALCAAQPAAAQENGVCNGISGGCAAGTGHDATFAAQPPPLFAPAYGATQVDFIAPSTTPSVPGTHSHHQAVRIDFAQLSQAREALADGRGADLTVNLPDLPLPVVLTAASKTRRGYALSGRVANDPLSAVNIVVNGRSVAGNIWRAGELHTIRTAGAGYYVQTLDGLVRPRCEAEHVAEFDSEAVQARRLQRPTLAQVAQNDDVADDGSEIDVLVVYTPSGRRFAGGHQGIRTLMEMLVQETNQAYGDSDVRQRIRLVAATEVDYELGDARHALNHLRAKGDGHLDEVHQLRDDYAADLVLLWTPSGGGLASIVDDPSDVGAESLGFSVAPSQAFAHELGHNMGLRHERSDDNGNSPYPYSHGYLLSHGGDSYRTIMHTDFNLLRFSNPRHLHPDSSGRPLGVPGDAPTSRWDGPADAARSLNNTATAVANFRPSATRCEYDLSSPADVTAEGGSYTISVTTAAACRWAVKTLDLGLSITKGSTGIGNGEVAFTVDPNPGLPREVALRVAGEVYFFRQDGGRQPVSVCARSNGVQEAISATLEGRPCAGISAGDLASIGSLVVSGSVRPGDFDGLSGLGSLDLRTGHSMTHLPPAIFAGAGLDNLRRLLVRPSGSLRLAQGAFEGLDALEGLLLVRVFWETGLFEGTPSLRELQLIEYPQATFPDDAFRGLENLETLVSFWSEAETVTFQGLPSLRVLTYNFGRLTHLPADAFEGLSELTHVFLSQNRLTTLHRGQFREAPKLRWIDLGGNSIGAVGEGTFAGLTIEYLNLSGSALTSLSADAFDQFGRCTLDLSNNRLRTLDRRLFDGLVLVRLDLSGNNISNIGPLSSASFANEINLSSNAIVDVAPLIGISGLSTLDLSDNAIVDVSPLAKLSDQLTYLDVSNNRVADIAALAELPSQLTYLDISNNGIADISPLVRSGVLGEGSSLLVYANPLDEATFDDDLVALRSRDVRVSHIHVRPIDSSAMEGEDFEFVVHLSSALERSISFDWQVLVADHHIEGLTAADLSNFQLTAKRSDFPGRWRSCWRLVCRLTLAGEVAIGAMQGEAVARVLGASVDETGERHETFGFALFPNASDYPDSVALPEPWMTGPLLAAAGLIVDPLGPSHRVPLFLARGDGRERQSVLRLVHPMDGSPAHVEAFDSLGKKHGTTTLSTREALSRHRPEPSRKAVAQFSSSDLEDGNDDAGLSRGVGQGSSDWHLKIWANDVKVRSYVRHADGFLTSMHDVAGRREDGAYAVPFFNPADNTRQRSVLRLVNPGTQASEVRIVGIDDAGASPGGGARLSIEPGGVRELSAAELEAGTSGLSGALGNGHGRWRLAVSADQPLLVASLLESANGRLANLSTMPDNKERGAEGATTHHVPLFLSANDEWNRHSFLRIVNKSAVAATVHIRPFDDTDRDYGSVSLSVAAGEAAEFDSHHLEAGGGGLSSGVGAGEGDWRLEVESTANIDVLAYVHHADDFLTAMHDMVRGTNGRHVVPIFNPADDDQSSLLRLVNPRGEDAEVSIRGFDDRGTASRSVRLVVPAGRSRTISAQELEAGHEFLEGALGDGEGMWRLVVRANVQIQVMSLLEGPAGHLTNLSTTP